MHGVQPGAIDRRDHLRPGVERGFLLPPVPTGRPVLGEFPDSALRDPAVPRQVLLGGPAGVSQPGPQVVDVGLRHVDAERGHGLIGHPQILPHPANSGLAVTVRRRTTRVGPPNRRSACGDGAVATAGIG